VEGLVTRKTIVRRSIAIAIASLVVVGLAPSASSVAPRFERPIIRLDEGDTAGATVLPAHAPVPATSTGIGPGSQIWIDRPDGSFICTANFIWTKTTTTKPTKPNGKPDKKKPPVTTKTLYLGAAGHCFLPAETTATHGPGADFDPALATVRVCVDTCELGGQGGPLLGTFLPLGPVAYARQTLRGVDVSNDFGIVEIPSSAADLVRPQMPVWQGPSSVQDVTVGGGVCLYGNAAGFGEIFLTKARAGIGGGLGGNDRYWKAYIPSFQGDSGSALVTCDPDDDGLHGRGAAGILTHIAIFPETGIVGTTTSRAVEMTSQDAGIDLELMLEDGTEVTPPALEPLPPQQPITPNEAVHPVGVGGSYTWSAGPFDRQAPPEAIFEGEACSGTEPASEFCDYEFVDLDVPAGGAELTVTVSTEDAEADDFDLFVYDPAGDLVDSAATSGTPPEVVSAVVTQPGTYTIGVDPYGVTAASYSGLVELKPKTEEPPVSDGEISLGGSYSWTGDPPVDANLLFTCAELVSGFCDNELIQVNVPDGGATLVVDISADVAGDDFDLCVYTPNGTQNCVSEAGDEHFELPVTLSGVHRVGVKSFLAPSGGYGGVASLR
jgi:hypothetical protein